MLANNTEVVLLEGDDDGDELRDEKREDETDKHGLAEILPISHVEIEEPKQVIQIEAGGGG